MAEATLLLPYSQIVGQTDSKLALELSYISPRIGGVLLSGERGTAKSSLVRAFARMVYNGQLPVTLPINATEDRVIGGWEIDALMQAKAKWQDGLLVEAHQHMLYVDEINLLDDYLVNLILDTAASGILESQRDGNKQTVAADFVLVGTMNPEEGALRPQLLDRFGLLVVVKAEQDPQQKLQILENLLAWDAELVQAKGKMAFDTDSVFKDDRQTRRDLQWAKQRLAEVTVPKTILHQCLALTKAFNATGHRGDYLLALAARAYAARHGQGSVSPTHLQTVAHLVLQHRRGDSEQTLWSDNDNEKVRQCLGDMQKTASET